MRFLALFLLLFTPLAYALWTLAGDIPEPVTLETRVGESTEDQPALLETSEIPRVPVLARVTEMKGGHLQRQHPTGNYTEWWLDVDRFERVDGKLRAVDVRFASFAEPKGRVENLRAKMTAAYIEGDVSALIGLEREAPRTFQLGGGVKVYDGRGRLMAELQSLRIDLDARMITSDEEIFFRDPERGAKLRGRGLTCNFEMTEATVQKNVRATLPLEQADAGVVTLSCAGPATLVRTDEGTKTTVTLTEGARVQHRDGSGRCRTIAATLVGTTKDEMNLESLVLEGDVDFDLDPELAEGLEKFRAHRITLRGDFEVHVEGGEEPVRAVRRGPFEEFGLEERVFDIETREIFIRIAAAEEAGKRRTDLELVRFPQGLVVEDRNGPGRLVAGWLEYDAIKGELVAKNDVLATAPGRKLEASRVLMLQPPERDKNIVLVRLYGKKLLELRATGRLGRLTRGTEEQFSFRCDGLLELAMIEERVTVRAKQNVVIAGKREPILQCDDLLVDVNGKQLQLLQATGNVKGRDPELDARLECHGLEYRVKDAGELRLTGKPARIRQPERTIEAGRILYREDGSFDARNDVAAQVALRGARWTFGCDAANGRVRKGSQPPERFEATGNVRANGPEGFELRAESARYTAASERINLRGAPASIRRGDEVSWSGSELDLAVVEGAEGYTVRDGASKGPARVTLTPKKGRIARWAMKLRGDALLQGDRLTLPDGADFEGFDAQGNPLVRGFGNVLEIDLERGPEALAPIALRCRKGLNVETFDKGKRELRLKAVELDYAFGGRELLVKGPGEAWVGDDKTSTLFKLAKLVLYEDGVRLDRLIGAQVSKPN